MQQIRYVEDHSSVLRRSIIFLMSVVVVVVVVRKKEVWTSWRFTNLL